MEPIYPAKLRRGDHVRIIAPSYSLGIISKPVREVASRRLEQLGFVVSFGENVEELDASSSSSVSSRLSDLHSAFANKEIKAIFAVIGGFNSNQLLSQIEWDLIKANPKIFIGYSDTTALQNAIFAKTGLVTYSGPAYSTFGQELYFDYTLEWFKKCLMAEEPLILEPAKEWTDDTWYLNQKDRNPLKNEGWYVVNKGGASGRLLGGNLSTFRLLQGTEFLPKLNGSILFLEDDEASSYQEFDRSLQSLLHSREFIGVRGLALGKFQKKSEIRLEEIERLIKTKKELDGLPVVANVDFGHTSPIITFPIGGEVSLELRGESLRIRIEKH